MAYETLGAFDAPVLHGINSFAGRSRLFDGAVDYLLVNPQATALLMAAFWALWFTPREPAPALVAREHLLATLAGGIVAIILARLLALSLHFRLRPRFDPSLQFKALATSNQKALMDWSSFPSDHAAVYFAIAAGLGFVSLPLGAAAVAFVALAICFPRVYFGYHYPTDILAGLAIGVACAYLCNRAPLRRRLAAPLLRWESASPPWFHAALFFLAFQFATMFDSIRELALHVYHALENFRSVP
jgi:undecaprenyl-diphosphatase